MPPQERAADLSPIVQQRTQSAPEMAYEADTTSQAPSKTISLQNLGDVVKLLGEKRDVKLKSELEHSAHLVTFRQGHIELRLQDNVSGKLANDLGRKLSQWTGERWIVVLSREEGEETIAASANRVQNARLEQARQDPLVAAALEAFPKAEILEVRDVFAQVHLDNPDADEDINSDD
jgi:DNA polymerase-3 subunit gamma/tau